MKKLSDLVNFKNQLDLLSTKTVQDDSNKELDKITHLFSLENYDNLLEQRKFDIQQSFDAFELELEKLKDIVKQEISVLEKPEFQKSYILYEGEFGTQPTIFLIFVNIRYLTQNYFKLD